MSSDSGDRYERHRQYKNAETAQSLEPRGTVVCLQAREDVVEGLSRREVLEHVKAGLAELDVGLADVDRFVVEADGPLVMLAEVLDVLSSYADSELSQTEVPAVSERERLSSAVISHEVLIVRAGVGPSPSPATAPDADGLAVVAIASAEESSE
jgi:hypothetical protein